jgi:uncharacterized membrane protein
MAEKATVLTFAEFIATSRLTYAIDTSIVLTKISSITTMENTETSNIKFYDSHGINEPKEM